MATAIRTSNRTRTATPDFKSKSDYARSLFAEGKTVAEVTRIVPGMGYAFAYGIAKRAGVAGTAANRRPTRAITSSSDGMTVTIRLADGTAMVVDRATGKTKRTK